jgi:multidrug efflux pump subunit AcrA (membrane-fusion protein)
MLNSRFKTLICALVIFTTISCGSSGTNRSRNGNSNAPDGPQTAAVTVTVGKSESREVASSIQATGSLIADETSDIAPKTAGKIANVYANVGQFIAEGATIATIDDKDARAQLITAQAAVRQAVAGGAAGLSAKREV